MIRPMSIHNGGSTPTTSAAAGWSILDYHHDDRLVVEDADPLDEEFDDREDHRPEKPFNKFRIQIQKPSATRSTTQVEDRTRRWSSHSTHSLPPPTTTTSSTQESRRRRQGYLLNSERRLSDQRDLRRSSILSSLDKLVAPEDEDDDDKLWSSTRSSSSTTASGTHARRSLHTSTSNPAVVTNDHQPQATRNMKTPRRHAVLVPVGSLSELWKATPPISSSQYDASSRTTTAGATPPPKSNRSTSRTKQQEPDRRHEDLTQSNNDNDINNVRNTSTSYLNDNTEEHNSLEEKRQENSSTTTATTTITHRAQRRGSVTKYSLMDEELHQAAVSSPSSSSMPFDLDNVKSSVVSTKYGSTNIAPTAPKVTRGRKQVTASKTDKLGVLSAAVALAVEQDEQDVPTLRSSSRTSRRRGSVTRYSLENSAISAAAMAAAWTIEDNVNPVAPLQEPYHQTTGNKHANENTNNLSPSSSNRSKTRTSLVLPASADDEALGNHTPSTVPLKTTRAVRRGVITKYSLEQSAY